MRDDNVMSSSDRGAVLVHTALALLALMAFTTFVVDYGVLWTGRRQAQNAADAAALGGATAIAMDDLPAVDGGVAEDYAGLVVQANPVWGQAATVLPADVTFPPCPSGPSTCIRVDVVRSIARGNPLPVFFGSLIGVTEQNVRATATAQVVPGNASDCLKPLAIKDVAPVFTLADVGQPLQLQAGPVGFVSISPGRFSIAIDLGAGFLAAMGGCVGTPYGIGDPVLEAPWPGSGVVLSGAQALYDLDPNAAWDPGARKVINSCVDWRPRPITCPNPNATVSPRVIPLAVYNDEYKIVNILGFFFEGQGNIPGGGVEVHGIIVTKPDLLLSAKGIAAANATFLKVITLIR